MSSLELAFASRMRDIDREEWDALAAPTGTPLLSWGFLALLEESGSIVPERGWHPSHLLLRDRGRLVAAAPLYLKTSSDGEFVFDQRLAAAAESLGAPYYPKLVGIVPATPAPVWRILTAPDRDPESLAALAVSALAEAARRGELGGLHFLWVEAGFAEFLRAWGELSGGLRRPLRRSAEGGLAPGAAFAEWAHQAFLWRNEGYGDFQGYLGAFSKNMRRNLRREREGLDAQGIERRILTAREVKPALLERMADFYEITNGKFGPWAAHYLTRDFFRRLPEFLPAGWLLGAAFQDDEVLGLSFLFEGNQGLWGRYWGAADYRPGLHFELCYNLPLEYALGRGLDFFDPGMGSEHKARRGFRSLLTPSFHLLFDPRAARLFEALLPGANAEEASLCEALNEELPFKRTCGPALDRLSRPAPGRQS